MRAKLSTRPDILNRRRAISRSEIHALQKTATPDQLVEAAKGDIALGKVQTRFALSWLRKKIWKSNGELRQTATAAVFGFRERGVIESLDKITFEGFRPHYNQENGKIKNVPIYKCHSETGATFSYAVDFWGRPEIVA